MSPPLTTLDHLAVLAVAFVVALVVAFVITMWRTR